MENNGRLRCTWCDKQMDRTVEGWTQVGLAIYCPECAKPGQLRYAGPAGLAGHIQEFALRFYAREKGE